MEEIIAKVVKNIQGTTPSAVTITKEGEKLVGAAAERQMITNS